MVRQSECSKIMVLSTTSYISWLILLPSYMTRTSSWDLIGQDISVSIAADLYCFCWYFFVSSLLGTLSVQRWCVEPHFLHFLVDTCNRWHVFHLAWLGQSSWDLIWQETTVSTAVDFTLLLLMLCIIILRQSQCPNMMVLNSTFYISKTWSISNFIWPWLFTLAFWKSSISD